MNYRLLFLSICAYPIILFLSHVLYFRISQTARCSFTPQFHTLGVVLAVWILYAICTLMIKPVFQTTVVWFYLLVVAGCWGNIYWFAFCVTESGRRQHIANLLADRGPLTVQDVLRIYDQAYIYENRVQRLIDLGEIVERSGRLHPRQSVMYYATLIFFFWSKVLGYRWLRG
jgi:hypothetical protein